MQLSKLIIAHLALRLHLFSCADLRDARQLCFTFQLDGCVDVWSEVQCIMPHESFQSFYFKRSQFSYF